MKTVKPTITILSFILMVVIGFATCTKSQTGSNDELRGKAYADKTSCVSCHRSISENYEQSSHYHTSAKFNNSTVELDTTKNVFQFNDQLRIVLEKRDGVIYQVAYSGDTELEGHAFDVSFGSGEKAQTYAYWTDNGLFQLPLSFYTSINAWANSPGFPDDRANFGRAVISRCLECHSSFAESKLVKSGPLQVDNQVLRGSVMYGIDCQRCHGPAGQHVEFHQENPGEKAAKFIVQIKNLSRQQQLDNCAVCHSGNDQLTQKSTFSFQPGDTLAHYFYPQYSRSKPEDDVHGKQSQMMAASACFIQSDMNCNTCHNPHNSGKELEEVLTQKCVNCHTSKVHQSAAITDVISQGQCINCHMPLQPSRQISFQIQGQGEKAQYLLRNHRIAVYPFEAERILNYLKSR